MTVAVPLSVLQVELLIIDFIKCEVLWKTNDMPWLQWHGVTSEYHVEREFLQMQVFGIFVL